MNVNSIELLNVVREHASQDYKERIPVATKENFNQVGYALTGYTPAINEFTGLLVKIGLQVFSSKLATNKLEKFKKGLLTYGTDIEEIFIEMAKAVDFDKNGANPLGRRTPDIKALYHRENYKATYEVSVSDAQVKNAFTSSNGMTSLLNQIVQSLYSGANYDEYLNMRNLLSTYKDKYKKVTVDNPVDETSSKAFMKALRKIGSSMEFVSDQFNESGVHTYTELSDQVLLIRADVLSEVDVDVLAKAFNMGKTDFLSQVVTVDTFDQMPDCLALLVDKDFFMVYDTLRTTESIRNPQGLFTNHFVHVWQTHSLSSFKNSVMFTASTPVANAKKTK